MWYIFLVGGCLRGGHAVPKVRALLHFVTVQYLKVVFEQVSLSMWDSELARAGAVELDVTGFAGHADT